MCNTLEYRIEIKKEINVVERERERERERELIFVI